MPAIVISLFASFLWVQPSANPFRPNDGVLSYATEISTSGLLVATNAQRSANGVRLLTNNSQLNAAAQAKAQHMMSNNYWAHVSPDGTQPWWFITNAGYQYLSAGENLAYGFDTSASTVTGWMNSPSHKANLLNSKYTEVGFGFVNSPNFTEHGPQTIVVAMYGQPQSAAVPAPVASKPTATSTKPAATTPVKQATEETTPAEETKQEPISVVNQEFSEDSEPVMAAPTKISRIQLLTGGSAVWSATLVILAVISAGLLWVMHKGVHVRRYIRAGENFLTRNVHLDLTVLSIIFLGAVLLTTTGAVL